MALARIRAARGRHEEASVLIDRAAALDPDDPRVLFWCADLEQDRHTAIERLERYLEIGDTDTDRLEAAKGSLRMLRALGAREIWIPTATPERVELPLQRLLAQWEENIRLVLPGIDAPQERPSILPVLDPGIVPGRHELSADGLGVCKQLPEF